ncbi:uncharacterized protein LOC144025439 [Festucalex cinctus]
MAANIAVIPPFVKLANVKGAVIVRRSPGGMRAGLADRILENVKRGYLTTEVEELTWRNAEEKCVICLSPNRLPTRWTGTGLLRPRTVPVKLPKPPTEGPEPLLPVKVLDEVICEECQINKLPRMKIFAQWEFGAGALHLLQPGQSCGCTWDGRDLTYCAHCCNHEARGYLVRGGEAEGWQLSSATDPYSTVYPVRYHPHEICLARWRSDDGNMLLPVLGSVRLVPV